MKIIWMKNYAAIPRLLMVLPLLLTACSEMPSNAPIDDRTNPVILRQKRDEAKKQAEAAADKPGFYTVKQGDNLLRIAQQFNQNIRDLVDWNKLGNANDIKVGQTLRVEPPDGAQVSTVQLDPGIESRPLNTNPAAPQGAQKPVAGSAKTGPIGNKVPYSDQAFAEMQRADAGPARALDAQRKAAEPKAAAGRFIWPSNGQLTQTFETSKKGIDISGQSGQPIVCAADGTVLYAKNMRGYGNLIIVDHSDGLVSAYAHNKTILVKEGQTVTKGQQIAEMGNTDSDVVKLHFEIRQFGKVVDPVSFLPAR